LTFLDLTVFISSVCILLVFSADGDSGEYSLILSIKKIFTEDSGNEGKADTVMYVNLFGIMYLLLQAILISKNLGGQHFELDSETVTPSDFAVIVRDIPKDITKEVLKKQLIEEQKMQVEEINFIYDVRDLRKINDQLVELYNQKKFYRNEIRKLL
jgi:hypothetical protein